MSRYVQIAKAANVFKLIMMIYCKTAVFEIFRSFITPLKVRKFALINNVESFTTLLVQQNLLKKN